MQKIIEWHLPIKTVSEANSSEHWTKKYKRHKSQRNAIWLMFHAAPDLTIRLPCLIKLTRISPRKLDYDNLCCSQKFVLDALCDRIIPGLKPGRADADERIKVEYYQEKGRPKEYSIRIQIFC